MHVTIDGVMPREKRWGALDSCFWLVGPHQQSIPQLLSLASRVYKGKAPMVMRPLLLKALLMHIFHKKTYLSIGHQRLCSGDSCGHHNPSWSTQRESSPCQHRPHHPARSDLQANEQDTILQFFVVLISVVLVTMMIHTCNCPGLYYNSFLI